MREVPELHRQYGPVVRVGPNHLAVDGSVGWSQVFGPRTGKSEFTKYPNFLFPTANFTIVGADTEDYRRQRRQLAHAFSEASLVELENATTKYIDLLMDRLTSHADSRQPVNWVNLVNFATFDLIGDLTFGEPFDCLQNNDYHPWVLTMYQGWRGNAMLRLLAYYPVLKLVLPLVVGSDDMRVAKEHELMSKAKAQARMALGEQPKARKDFTTYMLKKTRDGVRGMSIAEVIANTPALIVAGSETTASTLAGLSFYLGYNLQAYERLTAEICDAFSSEIDITMKSTSRLPYPRACLEERMRMYPAAAETPPRVSPGAVVGGLYMPKGVSDSPSTDAVERRAQRRQTVISVYQWATYRSPNNFTDPDSFRPERWLPSTHSQYDARYKDDNKGAFKLFSYRVRDCIGKNLAYSEMQVIVSRVLHRFDFKLEPGQSKWHDEQLIYLAWQKDPLYISLTLR